MTNILLILAIHVDPIGGIMALGLVLGFILLRKNSQESSRYVAGSGITAAFTYQSKHLTSHQLLRMPRSILANDARLGKEEADRIVYVRIVERLYNNLNSNGETFTISFKCTYTYHIEYWIQPE